MSKPQFVDGHPEPEWLSAWHDGELAGEAAVAVQAHVDGCAECRARIADYAALDAVGPWIDRELPDRAEWDAIDERLRARMDEEIAVPGLATQGRRRVEPPGFRLRWALATAAGLAVIVVGSRVLLDRNWGMGGILGPNSSVRVAAEAPEPDVAARAPREGAESKELQAFRGDAEMPGGERAAANRAADAREDGGGSPPPAEEELSSLAADAGPGRESGESATGMAGAATGAAGIEDAAREAAGAPAATLAKAESAPVAPLGRADAEAADSLAAARARIAGGARPAVVIEALLAEFDLARAGTEATARRRSVADNDDTALAAGSAAKSAPAPAPAARDEGDAVGADDPKRATLCRKALANGRAALALAAEYGVDISRRLSPGALAEFERCAD